MNPIALIYSDREKENVKRREEAWGRISQLAHHNPQVSSN